MVFGSAKQAEIIRSNQKDEYYISGIKSSLADIIQTFLGPRGWLKWRKEMDLVADLGYFALTTVAGFQTLGEEYVNIVQTDHTKRALPTNMTRVAMVMLQVTTPYLLDKLLSHCEQSLQQNSGSLADGARAGLTAEGRAGLLTLVRGARHAITLLHRCHLAAFYMRGAFYHVAKRVAGVHYILIRGDASESGRPNYRILGWLSVIQLAFTFLQHSYKLVMSARTKAPNATVMTEIRSTEVEEESSSYESPSTKCSLCLETRKHSTATPCGHLYCWDCIHQWAANKMECPLCRDTFQLSRLVCLQNYDL